MHASHVISNLCWYRYIGQIEKLAKLIPRNAVVLDLGCGWGFVATMLASLRGDLEIYSVDLRSRGCWREFKKYEVKYQVGNGTSLHFRDRIFDAVVAFGVLEHVEDKVRFLSEVKRTLKDGGTFFIFDFPNKHSLNEFMAKSLGLWSHECKLTLKEIEKMLCENGFRVINSKIQFLIPAQIDRVSKLLGKIFNCSYFVIQKIDNLLASTPLRYFAEAISVECKVNKHS